MFVELHMLQNFAPSCLNRDDTNAPKDCMFGGYRRARISSQCLKRAIRCHRLFKETVGAPIGDRTMRLVEKLADALVKAGKPVEQATEIAAAVVNAVIAKVGGDNKTDVLVYLGQDEIARMQQIIQDHWDELTSGKQADAVKAIKKEFKSGTQAADVALFGRMVAETTEWNIDAACQVAHSISTNEVTMEMDFYTALDDLQPEEEPGAGMMGTIEYNSACHYRYSLIDLPQLEENLGGDRDLADRTVEAFLRASVAAIPTGKQNSMAAQNPPSFVMSVVRDGGMPCSLVNAFVRPIRMSDYDQKSLVDKSIEALDNYWGQIVQMYGEDGIVAAPACWMGEADTVHLRRLRVDSVEDLFDAVVAVIGAREGT